MQDGKQEAPESASHEVLATEAAEIKAEFNRRWYRQAAISGQVLVFALPTLVMADSAAGASGGAIALALVSVLVSLVGSFWNWRCPHCSSYFGKKFFFLRFCSSCGAELA